jgi:aspartate racemase
MRKQDEKMLGVIGGLGPMATAYFMELVTDMTDAATDQEHLQMLIHSAPSIPDRTRYILDNTSENPLPEMLRIGKNLAQQGAERIAIPCVTAHYFFEELETGIPVPVINGVRETALHLKNHGITKAGIMATDGTVESRVFHRELEKQGIEAIVPSADRQADVMRLIFDDIKAGKPADMTKFAGIAKQLQENGAEAIILGCTELSLIKRSHAIGPGFLDAMEILAQQAIMQCGKPLKEAYRSLISK